MPYVEELEENTKPSTPASTATSSRLNKPAMFYR
jgi:hypothetical protein